MGRGGGGIVLVRDVATSMSVACWHAGVDRGSGASNNVCGVDARLLTSVHAGAAYREIIFS